MKVKRTFEAKRGLPFGAVCSGVNADIISYKIFWNRVTFLKKLSREGDSFLLREKMKIIEKSMS